MKPLDIKSLPSEGRKVFIRREFDKLLSAEQKIYDDWIKHKRCSCVDKIKPGKILRCDHIKDFIKESLGSQKERVISLSEEIITQELYLDKQSNVLEDYNNFLTI